MDKWNKKHFSVYENDEKSVLGILSNLSKIFNNNSDGIEACIDEIDKKVYIEDLEEKRKLDSNGNFTGSWWGIEKPTKANETIQLQVDQNTQELKNKPNFKSTGWANLNVFDEETKKIILGMEQGQINAILGNKNVNRENLADKSVGFNNINGEKANLFNPNTITDNTIVGGTGDIVGNSTNYLLSDYINVKELTDYTISNSLPTTGVWYNENKEYLSKVLIGETIGTNTIITAPKSACYIRLNVDKRVVAKGSFFIVEGAISGIPEYKDYNQKLQKCNFTSKVIPLNSLETVNIVTRNIFNPSLITNDICIDKFANEYQSKGVYCTDYIKILGGQPYTFKKTLNYPGFWYDDNMIPIKELPSLGTNITVTAPENACYLRWNGDSSLPPEKTMIIEGENYPNEYIAYNDNVKYKLKGLIVDDVTNEKFKGLKYGVFGDSLSAINDTATYRYHDYISDYLQVEKYNYAVSGSGFNAYSTGKKNFLDIIDGVTDDLDIITVFGGTNDYGRTTTTNTTKPFGEITDKTIDTFCGSVYTAIQKLINKFPNSKIIFFTPTPREDGENENKYGKTLKDYSNAIKNICEKESIPCYDLYSNGGIYFRNQTFLQNNMPDGLHLNDNGHNLIKNKCLNFIINNI